MVRLTRGAPGVGVWPSRRKFIVDEVCSFCNRFNDVLERSDCCDSHVPHDTHLQTAFCEAAHNAHSISSLNCCASAPNHPSTRSPEPVARNGSLWCVRGLGDDVVAGSVTSKRTTICVSVGHALKRKKIPTEIIHSAVVHTCCAAAVYSCCVPAAGLGEPLISRLWAYFSTESCTSIQTISYYLIRSTRHGVTTEY